MDDMNQRMEELVRILNEASDAYYNGRAEIMTDYEWDALFDELKALETETGTILENSPTQNVSADDIRGQKEEHEFSALSLAKTKLPEDLEKWAEGRPIWISWKLDGLTLVVTYDNGKLTKIVTRGDGHIGTNITHLAKGIEGIPLKIKDDSHLVIRGEAAISYEDFETFVMESGEDYANPRNLASGSLSLKDVNELKKRKIHWIPFTLVHGGKELISWGERMNYLSQLGFEVVERERIENPTLTNIVQSIDVWTKKVTDRINPYPVDGLVITFDDTEYAATGSITGHHATRAGYAFKWQDTSAISYLDHIEWSCAASTITPVAVFDPVELEGTVVKRASLCNISECERLKIGDQGTELEVIKANKIIPKVIKVTHTEGTLHIPKVCPLCKEPTRINISEISGTKTLKCTNPECAAKKLKKYTRFVSKAGMDIDGISEQILSRFINEGWIREYADIFKLVDHVDEIRLLDGFGDKSANNIVSSITKARDVSDQKLLYALNIPLVGQDVAKRLLSAYDLGTLTEMAKNADAADIFSHIDGIGPEKSASFVSWCKDPKNMVQLEHLLKEVDVKTTEKVDTGKKCDGLTFVVTGNVYQFKNRNELKAYIESEGGKVTGSVSGSTDYLINNDVESTSSKNKKAKSLGIPILSEQDFIDKFGQ